MEEKVEVVRASEEDEILDIELEENLLRRNEELAKENRRLLDEHGVLCIDVMGAIGSGKTALLEALVTRLRGKYRMAVIAGDVTTTVDADRIRRHGVKSIQVNTGRECHLDANLVRKALEKLNLDEIDILFIENVGNLICPADFPLGAHKRLVVVSVTEGEYMIIKHPMIFSAADVIVINKVDLADAMGVNPDKLVEDARRVNPKARVLKVSVKTGEGVEKVLEALDL